MSPGPWQLLIILVIILILFGGRGKISALMGDFGKGLKSFKSGLKEDEVTKKDDDPKSLKSESADSAEVTSDKDKAAS